MAIFPEIEGRQLEYKEVLLHYRKLCETVVAFSNDIGGRIIIGVRDADREVIGLEEQVVDRLVEDIPKAIYDSISPYCRPRIRSLAVAGKNLLEIEVFPGDRKPYFIQAKGVPDGVFFRIGSHNKRVTPELLEDLKRQSSGKQFDLEAVSSSEIKDFDLEILKQLYGSIKVHDEKLLADKVIVLDSLSQNLVPSISGHIYLHNSPNQILPQAEILLTLFSGIDNSQILKTLDLTGPLPSLAEQSLALIGEWIGSHLSLVGARKIAQQYDIPKEALREAIVNALVHRKYYIPDAIKIGIYSDRVEIYSPGNFPGPIGDLTSGVSYLRNPHLRQLARKHQLVEKRGLGLNLIISSCQKNGNPPPKIIETDDAVKVILYRGRQTIKRKLPIYATELKTFYEAQTPLSTSEASHALLVSPNTARKILHQLVQEGFLAPQGRGRGTRYVWAGG